MAFALSGEVTDRPTTAGVPLRRDRVVIEHARRLAALDHLEGAYLTQRPTERAAGKPSGLEAEAMQMEIPIALYRI